MLLFFIELLVRGTLLCFLIALALLLLRRAAATYRHLLCTLALGGLLTLPLVQELLPPLPLLEVAKPVAIANSVAPVVLPEPIPTHFEPIPVHVEPSPQPLPSKQGTWRSEERTKPSRFWLAGFWALGAAILLLRLAVALVRLRQLAKRSQRTSLLGTEILVSEHVTTPLTWGVRRPVILLPAALLLGDSAVAESALRHERAHIARRDWLWHLLAEVVCALCWFQPGAWWLRRRLRAESERACDDRVLLSGISGPDYAAHLLEILKVGRASALAPGMAAVGSMETRIKHILDPQKPRRAHGLRLALTAVLGLVLLPLASLKVAAKPGERPVSRLKAAVALLAPKLTFLTPSALLAQAKATLVAPKPLAPMALAEPTLAQPNGTLAMPQPIAPPQGSPAAEPPGASKAPDTTISLKDVHWGTAVDGLEPGFLLTGVTLIEDKLGTLEIGYTALVRNKTKQPITFLVRLLQYDGYDVPFTQDYSPKIPQTEYPKGVRHTDLGRDAVNLVTLAPGESVLVPGQKAHHNLRVLIGNGDGGKSPYFEKIKKGMMDMLVQPLTVYRSPDLTQLTRDLARYSVTKLAPDGTTRTDSSVRVSMPARGGTTLEAQLWLSKVWGASKTPAASATPTASEHRGRVIPLDKVIWNTAVDGLETGFLLTSSPRVPMNSKLTYQTLVRNTSNKPISFMTRLLQYDGYEAPTVDGKPTKGAKRGYPVDPLYSVTLSPGESVIVPAQNGRDNLEIFVGEGGSNDSPSIAAITPGHQKIVQPITVYRSPENLKFADLMGIYTLTKVSPDGRVRTEGANRASGKIEGGQTLEAYIYLEIGTLNAAAERNASAAVWGKVDKGLQCGIRMISTRKSYEVGDTLEAELLWRNAGDKKAHWVNPQQLDIVPLIRKVSNGSGCMVDMGARFMLLPLSTDYAPGEVRSLGVLRVTLVPEGTPSPKSNREPGHITLAPGPYFFSGSGGVSGHGDPCPRSGEVTFTVVDSTPQPQKDEGIAWGKAAGGLRYGLRDKDGLKDIEILVQNVSAQTQTITHTVWPPHLAGRLVLRDSVGKAMPLSQLSAKQAPRTETKTLRPEEIALLHTKPFHHMVDTLKQGETYTLEWQGGSTDQATGRLAFQPPAPDPTAWGRGFNGVQLGLRLPKGVTTFSKLSEAHFEVVLRNLGKPTNVSWIAPSRFALFGPDIFTTDGEPIPYEHTVAGPYMGQNRDLGSGETIVLGTIRIPREVQERWDALPQGPYLASGPPPPSPYEARFSLGITVSGKGEQKLSARLPFTVTRR